MFYLYELANVIPGVDIVGNKDITWQYISIDSRTIKKGELFIALKGERYDGHNFIREACQKGAAAVMMEKGFFQKHPSICEEVGHTLLLVENTVQALQLWAHYYHSLFSPLDICVIRFVFALVKEPTTIMTSFSSGIARISIWCFAVG